jgi:hypothetical protein
MPRMTWWTTLGALLALGGAAYAADGPCKAPRSCGFTGYGQKESRCDAERAIERKLSEPISLNFKDVPLGQAIDTLREMTGMNMIADVDALRAAGVSLEQPLTLRVNMSLKSALNILLKQVQLTYVIKDEALQITTEDGTRGPLRMFTYPVGDLVMPISSGESELPPFLCRCKEVREALGEEACTERPAGLTAEDLLMKLICSKIAPHSWDQLGGPGTLQYFPLGLALVANQTAEVQEQIADLLAELRRLHAQEDKEYTLETRVKYLKPGDFEMTQFPRITFLRGQCVNIVIADDVTIRDGSIRDFQTCWLQTAGLKPERLKTGLSLKAKVTAAAGGKLRLDVTLQKAELVEATRAGMQMSEQSDRVIRHVSPGETVKVVLSRNRKGQARSYLFLTLKEAQWEEATEHSKAAEALQGAAAPCRDKNLVPVSTPPTGPCPAPR